MLPSEGNINPMSLDSAIHSFEVRDHSTILHIADGVDENNEKVVLNLKLRSRRKKNIPSALLAG
jgi:hypothetical protein